jgi:hypothetical protein
VVVLIHPVTGRTIARHIDELGGRLYGHPGAPALGALGGQDLPASIARAGKLAAVYRRLSNVPVIPAFEIIATVAEGSPGNDGNYSYQTPWVYCGRG